MLDDTLAGPRTEPVPEHPDDVRLLARSTAPAIRVVDSEPKLREMLRALHGKPLLAVDFEGGSDGRGLGRDGALHLLQVYFEGGPVFVVHVARLRAQGVAWHTVAEADTSLKGCFESATVTKIGCDPRNDCDALFHQFGVSVHNFFCVQLAAVAWWPSESFAYPGNLFRYPGLQKIMAKFDCRLTGSDERHVQRAKSLMFPSHGGAFAAMERLPLADSVLVYAAVDVAFLPRLYRGLKAALPADIQAAVVRLSAERTQQCLGPSWDRNDRDASTSVPQAYADQLRSHKRPRQSPRQSPRRERYYDDYDGLDDYGGYGGYRGYVEFGGDAGFEDDAFGFDDCY